MITAVMFGAGGRGMQAYGPYALEHPEELRFVAVAEPDPDRRARFAAMHNIPPERQYTTWEDAISVGKLADAVFNCTVDQMHTASTLAAMDAGYEVLLEKPIAHTTAETVQLVRAAETQGRLLQICHVLRYTAFFQKVREIVQSGRLGDIINVDHRENLIFWHMAHSFVRGNWRNTETSAPMILAKCCHDLDILGWILGQPVERLSSFGSLLHFTPANAPDGAPQRCTDGCPAADWCKFYAPRLYAHDGSRFHLNAVTYEPTAAARMARLETDSPYGRCVYHCDNNVVDHQAVSMALAGGTTVTLMMQGHGYEEGRTMRYDGTRATLQGRFAGEQKLTIRDHRTSGVEQIQIETGNASGHGGGDFGLVRSFLNAMNGQPDDRLTSAQVSLESHLLAFAAEQARLESSVIDMADFRREAEALVH